MTAKPLICAHAGCENRPLDGLEAIEAGIDAGADFVELDLRFTADKTPILSHDPLNGRTIHRMVTLEQALARLAAYPWVGINVDVKELNNLTLYPTPVTQGKLLNPVYFSGLRSRQARVFQKHCPGLAHTIDNLSWGFRLRSRQARIETLTRYRDAGAMALNLPYHQVDQNLVDVAKEAGLPVKVWTVDDPRDMERMILLGVDTITTNRVSLLKRLLA